MASNLLPEEIQAILELLPKSAEPAPAGEVASRDFQRPKRLSPERRAALAEQAARVVPEIERELRAALRAPVELELADVDEINSEALFADLEPPFAIVRFAVQGEPGWASWDLPAAIAAIETSLGMPAAEPGVARALTSVEKTMLKRLLGVVLARLAKLWKLAVADVRVVDIPEELGSWRDAGPTADAQRIAVHLALQGPGGASAMRFFVPGVAPGHSQGAPAPSAAKKAAPVAQAPEHLGGVSLDVAVRLGSTDIPLADLLHLEIGDVIPLGSRADEPLRLIVEDRVCADVRLGTHDAHLAAKIERLRPRGREE